jgi:thymidylate synthase (FAD)
VRLTTTLLDDRVAPEQARMVLPLNTMTEWIWSGSLAAWARVCKLRLDPHAQEETRLVAEMFAKELEPIFPVSWAALMA